MARISLTVKAAMACDNEAKHKDENEQNTIMKHNNLTRVIHTQNGSKYKTKTLRASKNDLRTERIENI